MPDQYPGLWIAAVVLLGVVCEQQLGPTALRACVAGSVFLTLLGVIRIIRARAEASHKRGSRPDVASRCKAPPPSTRWLALLAAFALVGVLRSRQDGREVRVNAPLRGGGVTIRGLVDRPPAPWRGNAWQRDTAQFPVVLPHGRRVRVLCPATGVRYSGVRCASLVELTGRLIPSEHQRRGTSKPHAVLQVTHPEHVRTVEHVAGIHWAQSAVAWLRRVLQETVQRLYRPRTAGYLHSLLLGDRRFLDARLKQGLLQTGTFHFLAISGVHVGLVLFLLVRIPVRKRYALGFHLAALLLFTLVTGANPPVVRAAILLGLSLFARHQGCRAPPLNTLGWTVVLLVTWTPGIVVELGFQLSVCAVLFVLSWGPRWGRHLGVYSNQDSGAGVSDPGAPSPSSRWARVAERLTGKRPPMVRAIIDSGIRGAVQVVAISVSATLGTAPLILFYFQRLHPLSPLWNLCVYPFAALTLICGLLSVLLGILHPAVAYPLVLVEEILVDGLMLLLNLARAVPGTIVHAAAPPGWTVAAAYSLLIAGTLVRPRLSLAIGALLMLASVAVPTLHESSLAVDVLRERWGRAAVIRGAGKALLIDAGDRRLNRPTPSNLPGQILSLGAARLHGVFITSVDLTAAGGIDRLSIPVRIDRVFVPPAFADDWIGGHLLRALRSNSVPALIVDRGTSIELGTQLKVDVLYPPRNGTPALRDPAGAEPNASGFVLRVRLRPQEPRSTIFLFVAPLDARSGARFLLSDDDISADVLLIAPKTLRDSMAATWLRRVRPTTLVLWGGRGSPSSTMTDELQSRGVTVVDGRRGWKWRPSPPDG